ncbi:MAG TPA: alkaline phosphatase [Agriterribacter sp.]|nr:alkaline phosphatase [Agriterribacter sp.]
MKQYALKHRLFLILVIFSFSAGYGQTITYTAANGHAHNDYEHNLPFTAAYQLGFGSIEADVILENDSLYVGHNHSDIFEKPLFFERDYIQPLYAALQAQKDTARKVILLVDLKTEALTTLKKVMAIIEKYPLLTKTTAVQFVITGNQPPPSAFDQYPAYIYFDGNINNPEHIQHISRIALFSDNFRKYSTWDGKGNIPAAAQKKLTAVIEKAHALHRQIRFWGCPDSPHAWGVFMQLQVDYINTDHIEQLTSFFNNIPR